MHNFDTLYKVGVATCVVAWIEIKITASPPEITGVATCVVAWIEIVSNGTSEFSSSVATCVVAWIEISNAALLSWVCSCRHLRGGVDSNF